MSVILQISFSEESIPFPHLLARDIVDEMSLDPSIDESLVVVRSTVKINRIPLRASVGEHESGQIPFMQGHPHGSPDIQPFGPDFGRQVIDGSALIDGTMGVDRFRSAPHVAVGFEDEDG